MSFDVNIVSNDTNTYKVINSEICDFLTLSNVQFARCAKKPNSSKNIDINDIDRNNTNIWMGSIPSFLIKALHHSLIDKVENKIIKAPNKATIQ